MRTRTSPLLGALLLLSSLAGCDGDATQRETAKAPEVKTVPAGKNVTLQIQGDKRRVLLQARVCLREGQLEQLLTRRQTKEHEAVLAADIDGRDVHKALLAAGAEPGSPVQFAPKYKPASGTRVNVFVQWEEKGKLKTEPAQKWILNGMTKKDMTHHWVFAGSRFVKDPDGERPDYYLANDGDLICVANFESALLDLPVNSSSRDEDRAWVAHTERIPPKDTKVVVILEPVPDVKKADKSEK